MHVEVPGPSTLLRAMCAAVLVTVGLAVRGAPALADKASQNPPAAPGTDPAAGIHSPFARVAATTSPGVVYIEVRRRGVTPRRRGPFEEFFHDFGPHRGPTEMPTSGSGFVMDGRGYILTNNHVVDQADKLSATFLNGETYACETVGQDPRTDVAVIRITEPSRDGKAFPALPLGDSDEIQIGDWAIAVGNPFGEKLAGTVTVGVISAKGRSDLDITGVDEKIDLQDFIQTDASINFGNSGGPLVNIRGEVVGVNTALNAQGQGIGFAIPINLAARVAQQLIQTGKVRRGYLGIDAAELTRAVAEGNDWDVHSGILVSSVAAESPAEKAGLRQDDVIVEFNGRPVSNQAQFRLLVAETEVGSKVRLKVYRAGEYKDLQVTLEEDQGSPLAAVADTPESSWLGMRVQDLASAPEAFGLQGEERGVAVVEVEPGSPAAEKGVQPGSLILEIVNEEIGGMEDYNRIREELKDRRKPITVKIKEGGTVRYVALTPRP